MTLMVISSMDVPDGADEAGALGLALMAPTPKTSPKSAAAQAASQSGWIGGLRPACREAGGACLAVCAVAGAAPAPTGDCAPIAADDGGGVGTDVSRVLSCMCRLLA